MAEFTRFLNLTAEGRAASRRAWEASKSPLSTSSGKSDMRSGLCRNRCGLISTLRQEDVCELLSRHGLQIAGVTQSFHHFWLFDDSAQI